MLARFPPPSDSCDASFLTGETETFAKLKVESKAGSRTVMMTAHTLIMVLKGTKLLHLGGETIQAHPGSVVLLRKGIYVMAEYIEPGLDFEALMMFLSDSVMREVSAAHGTQQAMKGAAQQPETHYTDHERSCLVFPMTELVVAFKNGLRNYFDRRPENLEPLMALKQREILLLLMTGTYQAAVREFIRSAVGTEAVDIDYVVRQYLLQPVSVADLAELANCSLAKFKRDFQKQYGASPKAWINARRLEHAAMLLQNTKQTVSEVADACGFESTSHFIRMFRKIHGHTPGEHRAKMVMV